MRTMNNNGYPLIAMSNIQKSFNGQVVLNNIDLTVNKGEILAIIGPSGSGKSTLLRTLIKLVDIDAGEIWVNSGCLAKNFDGEIKYAPLNILRNIRLKFGMIFQNFPLFPHLTVLENIITAPLKVLEVAKEQAIIVAKELLKKVELEKYSNAYPCELSGGQKQRVAIARALAMKPDIMLFDEPTSALDPELAVGILKIIKNLVVQGEKTIVLITHQLDFVEKVADRVVFMDGGEIVEQGVPKELFSKPQSTRLRTFLSHR